MLAKLNFSLQQSLFLKKIYSKRSILKTPCPAGQGVKVSKYQIAGLIKVSILKATNRDAACPEAGVHAGIADIEIQVARIGTANRTTPIVAAGTNTVERTIAAAAEARHGQLKR